MLVILILKWSIVFLAIFKSLLGRQVVVNPLLFDLSTHEKTQDGSQTGGKGKPLEKLVEPLVIADRIHGDEVLNVLTSMQCNRDLIKTNILLIG